MEYWLHSKKKEETTDIHSNINESQMHYGKLKKPDSKENILYFSTYTTFGKNKVSSLFYPNIPVYKTFPIEKVVWDHLVSALFKGAQIGHASILLLWMWSHI